MGKSKATKPTRDQKAIIMAAGLMKSYISSAVALESAAH